MKFLLPLREKAAEGRMRGSMIQRLYPSPYALSRQGRGNYGIVELEV